jgi:hypothetical protein
MEMQEIGNLTRLKNLKDLRFSDPQWGDSPLALLHNYRVCKLPLFRKISSLFLHALLAEREREIQIMEVTLFSHPTLGFLVGRWLHLLPVGQNQLSQLGVCADLHSV